MSKYKCKCCNYITKRKHDFNKHLKTNKHRINEDNYERTCCLSVVRRQQKRCLTTRKHF